MASTAGRPLVAVTASIRKAVGSRRQPAVFLNTAYVEALDRAGLTPVLLTSAHSAAAADAILAACRGLVLSGGEDVAPARYGEEPQPCLGAVSPARDELEWRALDTALARGLPVLGICRGIQVLNVYFGGTLFQDLPSECQECGQHEQQHVFARSHAVELSAGSRLRAIAGAAQIPVNTFHHQSIRECAAALAVTAVAPDGIVEGVEARDGSWVVGVQWHPERQLPDATDMDPDRRLFAAFRDAVADQP
jgi:putative glutamine amidotransferase